MTRIGITGHSNLSDATALAVGDAMRQVLRPFTADGLIGLTCLARGADQVFAEVVLDLGGAVEVIIPAADYVSAIPDGASRARFDRLAASARAMHRLPYASSGPEAYFAASQTVIDRSDIIIAVWDGSSADGRGGTADAVEYARQQQCEIVILWPSNAQRVK